MLDTNEYIGALGLVKNSSSEKLLGILIKSFPKYWLFIPRTIVHEVRRNLRPEAFIQFIKIIQNIAQIDEDLVVPFEIGTKYESVGLKPADAFIAAYTEYVSADCLISENRHFLTRSPTLPFKVITASDCLKILGR